MAILSPDDVAYLRQAAARDHYNAEDALKVFQYESSGRPDIWGGKGKQYFGLFQAGPSERAQFGVDTQNPSARNQIDAFGKFLTARGFKPTMGLLDMYSTVNAGSPGHYNASDGNGTVASHVAAMLGQKTPAYAIPGSAPVLGASFQPSATPAAPDLTPPVSEPEIALPAHDQPAARGLLARLMPQDAPQATAAPQPDMPDAPNAPPIKRGRGLAFRQMTVKTPSFRRR